MLLFRHQDSHLDREEPQAHPGDRVHVHDVLVVDGRVRVRPADRADQGYHLDGDEVEDGVQEVGGRDVGVHEEVESTPGYAEEGPALVQLHVGDPTHSRY